MPFSDELLGAQFLELPLVALEPPSKWPTDPLDLQISQNI